MPRYSQFILNSCLNGLVLSLGCVLHHLWQCPHFPLKHHSFFVGCSYMLSSTLLLTFPLVAVSEDPYCWDVALFSKGSHTENHDCVCSEWFYYTQADVVCGLLCAIDLCVWPRLWSAVLSVSEKQPNSFSLFSLYSATYFRYAGMYNKWFKMLSFLLNVLVPVHVSVRKKKVVKCGGSSPGHAWAYTHTCSSLSRQRGFKSRCLRVSDNAQCCCITQKSNT